MRDKLTQFNALLPQYDVIVLSDYAKGSLVNVADMIVSAKKLGNRILVDPKGDDFQRYKGATILTRINSSCGILSAHGRTRKI